jgi:hypothetical protein
MNTSGSGTCRAKMNHTYQRSNRYNSNIWRLTGDNSTGGETERGDSSWDNDGTGNCSASDYGSLLQVFRIHDMT